eukprot:jgi/Hompol1/6780/HPOL_005099-RA
MSTQATTRVQRTFGNQDRLPRLPLPSLEATAATYLASCRPLLDDAEYAATEEAVRQFISPEGLGPVLQQRLVDYAAQQPNSWLEDIWLNKAYLEWREPSLINVNWWCQFSNHPDQPKDLLRKPPPREVLTAFQIKRAAGIISNAINYKELIDSERLPPEYAKDTPLCMNQYKNMFGTTRIPGSPGDKIRSLHPATAKHIIVLTKNQIYKVDVFQPDGTRVPLQEIERQLFAVGRDSLESEAQPAVGILTAGHRDKWFKAYSKMRELSPTNIASFDAINDALFALCLDDRSSHYNINASHHQIFHNYTGNNRWFDKAISFIVASNGQAGVNGEHTPADAVVPGNMMSYIVANEPASDPENAIANPPLPPPVKLKWVIDSEIQDLMTEAERTAIALIKDTESVILQTDLYGSRYIKEVAKTSPDAYVQIALQLTYYRYHQKATAVYETASTRAFKHGRTETGRSLSSESLAFIKSFDDDEVLYDEKRALFAKAIAAQTGYMKLAASGRGVDRHLLGLRAMMRDEDKDKPSMFKDPAFIKSMYFKLSTSNMSPGEHFVGGFGPVVPEGYGINYAISKDKLKFSISGKKSSTESDVHKFRFHLERTLKDMFILFPKRTEVWGYGWEKKHEQEYKEAHFLKRMKTLSDQYRGRQAILKERYDSQPKFTEE